MSARRFATFCKWLEFALAARAGDELTDTTAAAIDRIIKEVELIDDPHRAIDWLSTFPQVVLVALGESA